MEAQKRRRVFLEWREEGCWLLQRICKSGRISYRQQKMSAEHSFSFCVAGLEGHGMTNGAAITSYRSGDHQVAILQQTTTFRL